MFKGYCYLEDGTYTPSVSFNEAIDAVKYAHLQKNLFHMVRIMDDEDYIVLEIIDKNITYP